MPITPVDESTQNNSLPTFDTTLPSYDSSAFQTPKISKNTYAPGTAQYNVFEDYTKYLGRAPENDFVVNQWASAPNYEQGISGSPEALTYGRARNEVNPTIDSQIQDIGRQAAIQRTQYQNQLSALDPKYTQQFGALNFGLNEQNDAINQQLAAQSADFDVNSGRLGAQLGQVPLQAFQMANRRGLLDSTVAYDKLAELARPVQNSLSDLTRSYQNNRSAAQQKLQTITQKYNFDKESLVKSREQEAQAIRDALSTAIAQLQSQASNTEGQRSQRTYARAGELGDLRFQQGLQGQSLELQRQAQAEAIRQFNENLVLQKQAASKL